MPKLEIDTMLVLSTSHLSRETTNLVESETADTLTWGPSFTRDQGWIWHANQSVPPADLDACLKLAHDAGCVWVMFDCDGPVVEGLAVYEW